VSTRRPGDPRADALLRRYLATFPGAAVPVPVEAMAGDLLGLRVRVEPALAASGMLVPAARRIVVNGAETPLRRRFTLAHEVGHWTLHCAGASPPPILCRAVGPRPGPDAREREANVFAADLLMPEPELRAAWADEPGLGVLVERFGVSEEAMGWRLFNLGLVDAPPAA
jgi:Zn-dependent peptidase ImmA (M78 family)